MKAKFLFFALLATLTSFAQSDLNGVVKFVNNPAQAVDTTSVKPVFRRVSDGRLMRMTWAQLLSYLGGGSGGTQDLQGVANVGSTMSVPTAITLQKTDNLGNAQSEFSLSETAGQITFGQNRIEVTNDGIKFVEDAVKSFKLPTVTAGNYTLATTADITGNYVPLDGADESSPVTGDIFFEWGADKSFITISEDHTQGGQILFNPAGVTINGFNSSGNATLDINTDGNVIVTSTNRGLVGGADYTAVITDFDYVQKKYVDDAISSIPTGATNLTYTASPTNGLVNSDTGTDATIPLANGTNAGLESPVNNSKLANLASNANTTYAPLASPSFAGTPTAPTATFGTNTTQIATTGFVQAGSVLNIITDVVDATLTGTTGETILKTYTIPANRLSDGVLSFVATFEKIGVANVSNMKIYKNTSPSLSGAVQIARYNLPTTTITANFQRSLELDSGNIYGFNFTTSSIGGALANINATSTTTFNTGVVEYIIVTTSLNDASDTAKISSFQLTFTKQN